MADAPGRTSLPCASYACVPAHLLRWLLQPHQLNCPRLRPPLCVRGMRQIHRQEGLLRDLSRRPVLGRRSRSLRGQHRREAGHHGFHRIVVGWGMVGLVEHMELGSAKD